MDLHTFTQGTIVAHYGVAVEVHFAATGEKRVVRVKRNSGHVVGDRVEIVEDVLTRLQRDSELSRKDARGGVHTVGANLDVLCIVVACEPLPPPGFIDRAIVAARVAGLTPHLVLNKTDLPCAADYVRENLAVYERLLRTSQVSAESGTGLDQLSGYFREGHRGIFVGPTGVGKSSILNSLLPEIDLQTAEISQSKKRGRHTTTVSTLHQLRDGGELIDSPGFNDFGLVGISVAQLAAFFPGFEQAGGCHFRDCRHREEPGCRVTELLATGEISEERYTTYLTILTEVEALESQPDYRERRHRRKKKG
jgi:ribosome biogenesis GTPase / thiamine phosphate phosphatase